MSKKLSEKKVKVSVQKELVSEINQLKELLNEFGENVKFEYDLKKKNLV